jgi:acyl-CoA thioesterase I
MKRGGMVPVLAALLAGGILAGCARSPATAGGPAPASAAPAAAAVSIVALGDSVPRGVNCDCTPYPSLTAEDLGRAAHRAVTAVNDSVSGFTTDAVLHQLDSDRAVTDHVRGADAVEIEVGANDVAYRKSCGTTVSCYTAEIPAIEADLTAVVTRVRALAGGAPVPVVLLDYWSVWLGGAYAAEQGDAYVAAARELTDDVNAAVQAVATASGCRYVDLRAAFKGPDYAYDETHYLSDDGDHPNAAGHRRIADATSDVLAAAPGLR